MTLQGDIYLADLNEEIRRRVLIASNSRFNRTAGRAVVIPEIFGEPDAVPFPWRVTVDDATFAVDLLRTIPVERLLQRIGQVPHPAMIQIRRAITHVTSTTA